MEQKEEGYNSFKIAIPPDYANVFSHFYFAENISSKTITKILLPTYQTIFIFNFGTKALLYSKQNTQIEIDKYLVLGPIKKAFSYSLLPQSKILVANFKDDAFYRFFGNTSFSEGFALKPDELLKENCFTALWSELNKIDNPNQQVNYILEFCHPYLQPRHAIVEQLKNINDPSLNAIKAIALTNNQTERNIQIKQKKYFGYSVKEINRYHRFLKAVRLIENSASMATKEDWFTIIDHLGYYDQSHLINDFKYYLNLSPTKYIKFQQDICDPVN